MRKRSIRKPARIGPNEQLRLIAYEIHDGLCQQLAAGIAYLESHAEIRSESPKLADERFTQGMQALGAAMHESRELVRRLRCSCANHPHLVEAVNQLIYESHWSDSVDVTFHHDVPRDALSYAEFNTAFRIIQESLNNVARHSGSGSAHVEAILAGGVLRIRVEDAGAGFDPANVKGEHFGIEGMRRRVTLMKGQFELDSRAGVGTLVRAVIPVGRKASRR